MATVVRSRYLTQEAQVPVQTEALKAAGIGEEEILAYKLFQQHKPVGDQDYMTPFLRQAFTEKKLSRRILSLVLRGFIIDYGGGVLYQDPENRPELIRYLKTCGVENMLYADEIAAFNSLPNQLVIYRGGGAGMFWTLSKTVAIEFSIGKNLHNILTRSISKADILMFTITEGGTVIVE